MRNIALCAIIAMFGQLRKESVYAERFAGSEIASVSI